jgi:hypothetical protein
VITAKTKRLCRALDEAGGAVMLLNRLRVTRSHATRWVGGIMAGILRLAILGEFWWNKANV